MAAEKLVRSNIDSPCACQEPLAVKWTPRKGSEFTCLIELFGTDQLNFEENLAKTIILVLM